MRGNVSLMGGEDGTADSFLSKVQATADRLELMSRDIAAYS